MAEDNAENKTAPSTLEGRTATQWFVYAEEQEDQDNTQAALDAVEKAIKLDPRMGPAHCLKASLLLDQDKPREAFNVLEKACQTLPDDPQCWFELGAFLMSHKNPAQAARCFDRVYSLDPKYPRIASNYGIAMLAIGQFPQAVQLIEIALEEASNDADKAHLLNRLGEAQLGAEDFDKAIEAFDRSLQINEKDENAIGNMALAMCRKGAPEAALTCLEPAFEFAAKNPRLYIVKALSLSMLKRSDEADQQFALALQLNAQDPEIWFYNAQHLAMTDRQDLALQAYDNALKLDPDSPPILFQKSLLLRQMNRIEEAVACHRKGLAAAGRLVVWGLFLVDDEDKALEGTHIAIETDLAIPRDQIVEQYLHQIEEKGYKFDPESKRVNGKYRVGMTQLPPEAAQQLRQNAQPTALA